MDAPTRDRVVHLILHNGPQTAKMLADALDLTPAAIRRHLTLLLEDGTLISRDERTIGPRGRGRPAKVFALSDSGRATFQHSYDEVALAALRRLSQEDLRELAEETVAVIEQRFQEARARAPERATAELLVEALDAEHFAASVHPVRSGQQLVQFHCPIADVAAQYPIICEIETQLFGRLLDSHVQRLATIGHGDGVCTTHIPAPIPTPIPKRK